MNRSRWTAITVAFALILSLGGGTLGADSNYTAAMSDAYRTWLKSASASSTSKTVVTFHDRAGMSRLDSLQVPATKLTSLPIAFTTLSATQAGQVASWPEVRSLWHSQQMTPLLDESVPLIGADRVHRGDGLKRAYTGAGANVAVIDTGVDATHPDLPYGAKVDQYAVVGDPFVGDPVVFTSTPTGDTYGHGTHVSSTIAGTGAASGGAFTGVAPGARITSFKTDAGAFLLDGWILASFDWILSHPEAGIRVSSNSWGCCAGADYDPNDPINVATKALYDAGVTVVFSAGNSGGPNTLGPHAASPWVIGVAAGAKDMSLATFSSRGRIGGPWDRTKAQRNNSGVYRPTITAPGVDIEAAKSSQATVMALGTDPENPMYTYADGTSMAAPHVAGTVALMLEARPKLGPQHVINIIEGTATNMPDYAIWETGVGYLNAYDAVKAAEKGRVVFRPSVNGKTPTYALASSAEYSGTVLPNTWAIAQCPDTTGLLNHHPFDVAAGTAVIYADLEWESETQLIYLRLYDPNCEVAAQSAALLDIGSVNFRSVAVTNPAAGTWTVAVYGRINAPYPYSGHFETYTSR